MNTLMRMLVGLVVCLSLAGCTGTRMKINPAPESLQQKVAQQFDTLGVKEIPGDKVYPPAGHVVQDFARELELSQIARTVYYPTRPDDKTDMMLEAKFDVTMDPHMGGLMAKSFAIGLSLFLLEPVFWYHFDYDVTGRVDVIRGGKRETIEARTQSRISMKWLSMGQAQSLEMDALKKSKESVSRQLIQKLGKR